MIIQRKLTFYAHIILRRTRDDRDRLLKQILFDKTDDKNKRGRPRKRWTDDLVNRKIRAACSERRLIEPSGTNL